MPQTREERERDLLRLMQSGRINKLVEIYQQATRTHGVFPEAGMSGSVLIKEILNREFPPEQPPKQ
jgi:hypothetical protein